ncbi:MAG: xanthine dehydrogenase family protein subunit M [Alphaproteobacteria bacterium]
MKAAAFDYIRADSVDAACRALADANGDGKVIAGGQTLVPLMAMRLTRPSLLVDINRIDALRGVSDGDVVTIGTCTRHEDARRDPLVRRHLPLLAKAIGFVGHQQIRNRGTVGGSLANADPAAEIALATLLLDAEVEARSPTGSRAIALNDFLQGAMETALADDEVLTAIRCPKRAGGTGFQEIAQRHGDFALTIAAAQVELNGDGTCARIALGLGGVEDRAIRLPEIEQRLTGAALDNLDEKLKDVADMVDPMTDQHASATYRRRIAGPLLKRAIEEAVAEARA